MLGSSVSSPCPCFANRTAVAVRMTSSPRSRPNSASTRGKAGATIRFHVTCRRRACEPVVLLAGTGVQPARHITVTDGCQGLVRTAVLTNPEYIINEPHGSSSSLVDEKATRLFLFLIQKLDNSRTKVMWSRITKYNFSLWQAQDRILHKFRDLGSGNRPRLGTFPSKSSGLGTSS